MVDSRVIVHSDLFKVQSPISSTSARCYVDDRRPVGIRKVSLMILRSLPPESLKCIVWMEQSQYCDLRVQRFRSEFEVGICFVGTNKHEPTGMCRHLVAPLVSYYL